MKFPRFIKRQADENFENGCTTKKVYEKESVLTCARTGERSDDSDSVPTRPY